MTFWTSGSIFQPLYLLWGDIVQRRQSFSRDAQRVPNRLHLSNFSIIFKHWIPGSSTLRLTSKLLKCWSMIASIPPFFIVIFILSAVLFPLPLFPFHPGGMLALGSSGLNDVWFVRGVNITETCRLSYENTATHLGPESFEFGENIEAIPIRKTHKSYLLRPETVESYFYLWRFTKNPIYRQWAWDVVKVSYRSFDSATVTNTFTNCIVLVHLSYHSVRFRAKQLGVRGTN